MTETSEMVNSITGNDLKKEGKYLTFSLAGEETGKIIKTIDELAFQNLCPFLLLFSF